MRPKEILKIFLLTTTILGIGAGCEAKTSAATIVPTPILPTEAPTLIPLPTLPPPTPTLTSTPSPKPQTLLEVATSPFLENLDEENRLPDRQYPQRSACVDSTINQNRLNILGLLRFETFEPPVITDPGNFEIGFSLTSLNLNSGEIMLISMSDDFNVPMVAKEKFGHTNAINPQTRLNQSLNVGGFPLLRQQIECATSLKIHRIIIVDESELSSAVNFLGGIDFQSTEDIITYPYFWQGQLQPPIKLSKGQSYHFDGPTAVGIFKSVPNESDGYNKNREHHVRAAQVLEGIIKQVLTKSLNEREKFFQELSAYSRQRLRDKTGLTADFPLARLEIPLKKIETDPLSILLNLGTWKTFPKITARINVADDRSGSFSGVAHGCNGVRYGGDMFIPKGTSYQETDPAIYWGSLNRCFRQILQK